MSYGTAITQSASDTFTISQSGNYCVRVVARTTTLSLLGTMQLELNGTAVGPAYAITTGGVPFVLEAVLTVASGSLPASLQVAISGLAVTLASGTTAMITIEQLSQ